MIPQKWKHFGNMFPCEKIGKKLGKKCPFLGKNGNILYCPGNVSNVSSWYWEVHGSYFKQYWVGWKPPRRKMTEIGKNGNILWGPGNGCDVSGWCWEVYVS